ncbi:MAG: spore coat protein H [Paraglaciecola sp.]|jgi:spore coat protein H
MLKTKSIARILIMLLLGLTTQALFAINDTSFLQDPQHQFWHDTDDLPTLRLTFSQDNWDLLLTSSFDDREEVSSDMTYIKGGQEYELFNIGAKLSGNTSFTLPVSQNGGFIQASFTLDFDEFVDDQILSGVSALKLKRFNSDSTFVHEPLANQIMHNFNVWTAHSSTHLKLEIKIADSDVHYFGIYRANESVNRHEYIDKRFGAENDGGFLWQGNYKSYGPALFSRITQTWEGVGDFDQASFEYKGKGSKFDEAHAQLVAIAQNFTNLQGADFEEYVEQHINMPLFLKSMASEAVLGHWDGFWGNNNNFMFYIDESEVLHFIPFDTDNAMGTSLLVADVGERDPFFFGREETTPLLVSKVLAIDQYRRDYAGYVRTMVEQNDLLSEDYAVNWIANIHDLIEDHLQNVTGEHEEIADRPASWGNQSSYRLYEFASGKNYYATRKAAVIAALGLPIADAGPDVQLTVGESFDLIATSSTDPNGEIVTIEWLTEQNGNASSISFSVPGTYTATLTVTDNDGYSASDDVIITVIAAPVIDDISSGSGGVFGSIGLLMLIAFLLSQRRDLYPGNK